MSCKATNLAQQPPGGGSKLPGLQALRGAAVILVVLVHILAFEPKAGVGPPVLPTLFVFGAVGVDLFFVLSGFIMVHTTRESLSSMRTSVDFLARRAARIYPLYWLYTGVVLAVAAFAPHLIHRPSFWDISIWRSLLLWPQEHYDPILAVGWSLVFEMYFYLVFACFLLAPRRMLPLLLCLWFFVAAVCSLKEGGVEGRFLVAHPMSSEFILGCAAGLAAVKRPRAGGAALAAGLLYGAGAIFLHYRAAGAILPAGWLRPLVFGPAAALLVFGMAGRDYTGARKFYPEIACRIGDASYSVYLSHFLVISCLARAWSGVMGGLPGLGWGAADNLLFCAAALALSLAFGALSYRWLEKPLLAAFRKRCLPGERLEKQRGEHGVQRRIHACRL